MRNIYPILMIKMVSGNKKIYIQISAVCIGICAYMHATFLVVEEAESNFLCLLLKEAWIYFNLNIV